MPTGNLNPSAIKTYRSGERVHERERIVPINPNLDKVEQYSEIEATLEIWTVDGERIWLTGTDAQVALSDIRAAGL